MQSNLHDAIFAPETLEMWFADAGSNAPACDEPYAHVNLSELIEFYQNTMAQRQPSGDLLREKERTGDANLVVSFDAAANG